MREVPLPEVMGIHQAVTVLLYCVAVRLAAVSELPCEELRNEKPLVNCHVLMEGRHASIALHIPHLDKPQTQGASSCPC